MNDHSRTTAFWWYIVIALEDASDFMAEEVGNTLIELGAGGTILLPHQKIACYLQATEDEKTSFLKQLEGRMNVVEVSEVQDENWTALCEELWQPVVLHGVTIVPILEDEQKIRRARKPGEIFLLPGTGFGTGHHGTTAGMVELLHANSLFGDFSPSTILDVGTGSAILSLVTRERFPTATIDACDICPQALENATCNLRLNEASEDIHLVEGSIDCYSNKYDLIMANIFPEVLITLADDFLKRSTPGGLLLLSGIMTEKRHLIKDTFDMSSTWNLEQELLIDGWYSIAYKQQVQN